jgi:hypothetical protein
MLGVVLVGGSIASLAITLIVLFAVVAIVYIAAKVMGITIPNWVVQIFWVVVVAFVCIAAIRIILSA